MGFLGLERRGVLVLGPEDEADQLRDCARLQGGDHHRVDDWRGGCVCRRSERNGWQLARRMPSAHQWWPTLRRPRQLRRSARLATKRARGRVALWLLLQDSRQAATRARVRHPPDLARIAGRVVDPVRYAVQKIRFLLRPPTRDPALLDLKSGLQAGRVVLAPGPTTRRQCGSSPPADQGSGARSGSTQRRRASAENRSSGSRSAAASRAGPRRRQQRVDPPERLARRLARGPPHGVDEHLGDRLVIALGVAVHAADALIVAADQARQVALGRRCRAARGSARRRREMRLVGPFGFGKVRARRPSPSARSRRRGEQAAGVMVGHRFGPCEGARRPRHAR